MSEETENFDWADEMAEKSTVTCQITEDGSECEACGS